MPVITIEAAKLTKEQKAVITKEMTETASRVMNLPSQAFYVFIKVILRYLSISSLKKSELCNKV